MKVIHRYQYKTDIDQFQKYRKNHIDLANLDTINVKYHSTYIDINKALSGTFIEKSVFSMATYQEVLRQKGGDIAKMMDTKFPLSTKGSQVPDEGKVSIDRVMLVCQCPNSADVMYADSDGYGRPGMMGLWDLHSNETLNW